MGNKKLKEFLNFYQCPIEFREKKTLSKQNLHFIYLSFFKVFEEDEIVQYCNISAIM